VIGEALESNSDCFAGVSFCPCRTDDKSVRHIALLFRRLGRIELTRQLLDCAENLELRRLVLWLFVPLVEIFAGSHAVGHNSPPVQ
jgi:hypothetical protein